MKKVLVCLAVLGLFVAGCTNPFEKSTDADKASTCGKKAKKAADRKIDKSKDEKPKKARPIKKKKKVKEKKVKKVKAEKLADEETTHFIESKDEHISNPKGLKEENLDPELISDENPLPVSQDLNSKEAIAYLRKLPTIIDVEKFIKGDKRITVSKASVSRINALRERK